MVVVRSAALLLLWVCATAAEQSQSPPQLRRRLQTLEDTLNAIELAQAADAARPSASPSAAPSGSTSSFPSLLPSVSPTISAMPTDILSTAPSAQPSAFPSVAPTSTPTALPSDAPSIVPSPAPSAVPTVTASDVPSSVPTISPSSSPSTAPSDIPSNTPSSAPSDIPSTAPSDIPSNTPSSAPSDMPSNTPSSVPSVSPNRSPSTAPSSSPSDVPSLTPSMAPSDAPSLTPSDVPSVVPSLTSSDMPSLTPSDVPSDVPSLAPSDMPSLTPSDVPSDTPSVVPSATPSVSPSGIPSDTPSVVPSATLSVSPSSVPSDTPSAVPSPVPSVAPTSVPSDIPSVTPTRVPTTSPSSVPSDNPSILPSVAPSSAPSTPPSGMPSILASSAPSFEREYVAVDALNLIVSQQEVMNATTIQIFEATCSEFLPTFLPAVYQNDYQFVECQLLSQSLVNLNNRFFQPNAEGDANARTLAILVRVSARTNLPDSIKFNDLVGQVFGTFSRNLESQLAVASNYFIASSSLVPSNIEGGTQGRSAAGDGNDDDTDDVPLIPIVAAAVGGAVLAVGVAAFLLIRRDNDEEESLPTHQEQPFQAADSNSMGSMLFDDDYDYEEQKTGTQMSESTTGPFLPPTPIGLDAIPSPHGFGGTPRSDHDSTDPQLDSAVDQLLPTVNSKDRSLLSEVSRGSHMAVMGTEILLKQYKVPRNAKNAKSNPHTSTRSSPRRGKRQDSGGSNNESISSKKAVDAPETIDQAEKAKFLFVAPVVVTGGTSVSGTDRSLQAMKRQSLDEDDCEIDALKLIGNHKDNPKEIAGSSNRSQKMDAPDSREASDGGEAQEFVVNPSPRQTFFGFGMGFRKKQNTKHQQMILPATSDVSIDPRRAAGTPRTSTTNKTSQHATIEECHARSPKGRFVRKNETPSGSKFLQMNLNSAEHTGSVLDDLGKSERQWKGHLNSVASCTADTPRVGNTQTANTHRSRRSIYRDE